MSSTRTPTQLAQADSSTRAFSFDPVCKVVAMLTDLAHQRRPIDPRLLHCCLSLITASSQLPHSAAGPTNPTGAARTSALTDSRLGA